ncbi:MAG TPA: hypothetical protein VG796_04250 [Verrucomicrobiales bacterium]|nr:hypothetical protein [Verrucomicrobiales bacterium]
MAEELTIEFRKSQVELYNSLIGDRLEKLNPTQESIVSLAVRFLKEHEVAIIVKPPAQVNSRQVDAHFGGTVFFSVKRFVWESLSTFVGFAAALAAGSALGTAANTVKILQTIVGNLSILKADSIEFRVYATIIKHFKETGSYPNEAELLSELEASGIAQDKGKEGLRDLELKRLIVAKGKNICPQL